jgi:hypothetical protein
MGAAEVSTTSQGSEAVGVRVRGHKQKVVGRKLAKGWSVVAESRERAAPQGEMLCRGELCANEEVFEGTCRPLSLGINLRRLSFNFEVDPACEQCKLSLECER